MSLVRHQLSMLTGRFTPGIQAAEDLGTAGMTLSRQPLSAEALFQAIQQANDRDELVRFTAALIDLKNPDLVTHAEAVAKTIQSALVQGFVQAEEGTT